MQTEPKYKQNDKVIVTVDKANDRTVMGTIEQVYENKTGGLHMYMVKSIEGNQLFTEEPFIGMQQQPPSVGPSLRIDPDNLTFGRVRITPHPHIQGAVHLYFRHVNDSEVVGETGPVPFTAKELIVAVQGFKAAYELLVPEDKDFMPM